MTANSPAECIRTARTTVAEVMQRLRTPVTQNAEQCTDLLTDVEANLRSALDMLHHGDAANAEFTSDIEHLRREVKTLALALAASDRVVSGWIRSTGSKNGGYTDQGGSAPLFLVKRLNVTG